MFKTVSKFTDTIPRKETDDLHIDELSELLSDFLQVDKLSICSTFGEVQTLRDKVDLSP